MKNNKTPLIAILSALTATTVVVGCGQSKVDYNKHESPVIIMNSDSSGQPQTQQASDDGIDLLTDPRPVTHPELMGRAVRLPTMTPLLQTTRFSFQTWEDRPASFFDEMTNRSATTLTEFEMDMLGSHITTSTVRSNERTYTLNGNERKRCVFRNRLLPRDPSGNVAAAVGRSIFPAAFNSTELGCVTADHSTVRSSVRLAVSAESRQPDYLRVRLVGSTASKVVRRQGIDMVEFRMTTRLAPGQADDGASKRMLDDSFDVLLSSYLNRGDAQMCALERDYYLAVTFNDGAPVSAGVIVKTRNASRTQMQNEAANAIPLYSGHRGDEPTIDARGIRACQSQHLAWLTCVKATASSTANANCDVRIVDALDKNFRELLDARYAGFATDRMFAMTRAQGNGVIGRSPLLWRDNLQQAADGSDLSEQLNPLAIEDFQELYDVIQLRPSAVR